MELFYGPDLLQTGRLSEEETRHCTKVLRHHVGDKISVITGAGELFVCEIVQVTKQFCAVDILQSNNEMLTHRDYSLHIAIAPTKNIARIEWFLEKTTEIGIDKISFIITDHSERRNIKIERLEKVVVSALKQSKQAIKPIVEPITKLDRWLQENHSSNVLLAHYDQRNPRLTKVLDRGGTTNEREIVLLIGPEGDFSTREVALIDELGVQKVNLTNSRLRTETAGIMSAAIVNTVWG